jgi:hypothetical protein
MTSPEEGWVVPGTKKGQPLRTALLLRSSFWVRQMHPLEVSISYLGLIVI